MTVVEALAEAISFENEDRECITDTSAADCWDSRCRVHGCMVARVNRWRAALASFSPDPPMSTQPGPGDVRTADEAFRLGEKAFAEGKSRMQWPSLWRDQTNIEAWIEGYDAAAREAEEARK